MNKNMNIDIISIILPHLHSREIYNFSKTSKQNNIYVTKYKHIYYESYLKEFWGETFINILKTNENYKKNLKDLYNKYKYNTFRNNLDIIQFFFQYLENQKNFKWNNDIFIFLYDIFYYLGINQYRPLLLSLRKNFLKYNNITKDDKRFMFIMGVSSILDRSIYTDNDNDNN
jgi:hypothetical protein